MFTMISICIWLLILGALMGSALFSSQILSSLGSIGSALGGIATCIAVFVAIKTIDQWRKEHHYRYVWQELHEFESSLTPFFDSVVNYLSYTYEYIGYRDMGDKLVEKTRLELMEEANHNIRKSRISINSFLTKNSLILKRLRRSNIKIEDWKTSSELYQQILNAEESLYKTLPKSSLDSIIEFQDHLYQRFNEWIDKAYMEMQDTNSTF